MAGVKGRSGRRPLSVEHHLRQGTYRKDRHGPKPARATVARFPVRHDAVPVPLVADLGKAGSTFVADCWRDYKDWSTPQQLLLQRCGQLVDLEVTARASEDIRQWMSVHKLLLATIAALGLREA